MKTKPFTKISICVRQHWQSVLRLATGKSEAPVVNRNTTPRCQEASQVGVSNEACLPCYAFLDRCYARSFGDSLELRPKETRLPWNPHLQDVTDLHRANRSRPAINWGFLGGLVPLSRRRHASLLALLFVFTVTAAEDVSKAPVTATGEVAKWFVESEWIKFGGDYKGAEGTQWIVENDEPTFIYAAHHDFLAFKWSKSRGLRTWRDDSPEATSFRPDGKGGHYVVEQTTRRVTRWDNNAKAVEVLAERYQGKRLNRPNDLRVKSDGSLWFTDPAFMYGPKFPDQVRELDQENVYRLDPKNKKLTCVSSALRKPNGIAFSPDEKWLYLTDAFSSKILRCRVQGDTIGPPESFVDLTFRGLDGLAFDPAGNLWCGTRKGAYVYSPEAKLLGTVTFEERVSSFAFHQLANGKALIGLTTKTAAHVATLQLPTTKK